MKVLLYVNGIFWKERKIEILGTHYIEYVTIGKPKLVSWHVSRHYDYPVKFDYMPYSYIQGEQVRADVNDPRLVIDESNHLYAKKE